MDAGELVKCLGETVSSENLTLRQLLCLEKVCWRPIILKCVLGVQTGNA
jgi:hypothetical protein